MSTSTAWNTIVYLQSKCSDIDRPFFEALIQGRLLEALQLLEAIERPTHFIAKNLDGIMVSVCGSRPVDEVQRWFKVWGTMDFIDLNFEFYDNIYEKCVIEAVQSQHMDVANYVYQMGLINDISHREQSNIVVSAVNTKNLDVLDGVCKMFGEAWDDKILIILVLAEKLPLNDDLFCFINNTFTPEHISKAEDDFSQSKTFIFGPNEDQIEYANSFWEGLRAYQQRVVLGQEVEQVPVMAAVAPKSKM